jgi:hypothetical protein
MKVNFEYYGEAQIKSYEGVDSHKQLNKYLASEDMADSDEYMTNMTLMVSVKFFC